MEPLLWVLLASASIIAGGKIVAACITARAMVRATDQRHLSELFRYLPVQELGQRPLHRSSIRTPPQGGTAANS